MAEAHGAPEPGAMCLTTFEDIDETNYCEYQTAPSGAWQPSKFEQSVVEQLVATQFETYCKAVQKSDCAAEMRRCAPEPSPGVAGCSRLDAFSAGGALTPAPRARRLMEKGPPVWVSDQHGLTLPEGDTHVQQLWFMSDGQERSAKLAGALEGEERQVRTSPRLPAPLASSLGPFPAPFRPPTPPPSGPIARADTSVSCLAENVGRAQDAVPGPCRRGGGQGRCDACPCPRS